MRVACVSKVVHIAGNVSEKIWKHTWAASIPALCIFTEIRIGRNIDSAKIRGIFLVVVVCGGCKCGP